MFSTSISELLDKLAHYMAFSGTYNLFHHICLPVGAIVGLQKKEIHPSESLPVIVKPAGQKTGYCFVVVDVTSPWLCSE